MAEYNVDIQVRAKTQQATKGLTDVEAQITGIIKKTEQAERRFKGLGQVFKGFGGFASSNVKAYGKSLSVLDKQLGGLGKRLGDVAQAFDFGGKTVVGVAGINAVANAAAGLSGRFGGALGAIRDFGSGVADLTAPVNAVTSALQAMGPAGMATAGGIAAATAAFMAFAPAAAKAVGPAAGRRVQELAGSFNRLDEEIKATAGSFESLIKGSTLNQLNAQLEDAKRQVGEYRSNTEEARISAQQLVAVTKQQAIEQRAINDLVRQAKGITQTELEEAKAVKSLKVARKREEILKKEAKAAKESAEATRRREEALSQEARERTAATIAKRQKALEEETRRTQEAIKANYELGRAQDILADKRANAVLEMARQRRMAGTTMYGPGGAGPATAGFAANVEAARQVDAQNKAFAEGAKQRIEWEKKVNEISTSLQKELNSLRTKHRRERYFREIKLAEQAAKYVEGLERKAAQRAESLALGVGFPLLFGGGVGSVAGGALGSVIGSQGFGGQIIFSAIGQQIDTVVANVAKLGQALNPLTLDLDAVTTAAGISGTALEKYLKELETTAGKAKAAEEAQKALAAVVGDEGIDALEEFGEATQNLSNAFDRAMSRMAAGVARLINSIPGFLQFTSNLERGGVLQRALASTDPAQAGNLQRLEQARVGKGGVDIGKYESAIEALIRTQRTIEAGGGSAQDMTILNRQLEVDKARVALAKAGSDLADDAVFKARQQLQIKEHALRIEEVSQKDLTDAARNVEFEKLALRDERERVQLANDRAAALSKVTKKGAKEGERVAKEVALLKIRNGLTSTMLTLDTQIADAKRQGRVEDAEDLERSKVLLQGLAKEEELRIRIKDASELAAKIRANDLNTQVELAKLAAGVDDRKKDETDRAAETMAGLQNQLELEQARLDGKGRQVELEQRAAEIASQNKNLSEDAVLAVLKQIDAAKQLVSEQERMKQVFADIGMTIKDGVVDAIGAAVDGTKTLSEVANNMLRNIANRLLDIGMNFLMFGVPTGVGTGGGLLGGLFRADGGPVSAGSSYIVGERGPELFTPKSSGMITPNHALGGGTSNIVVNVDAGGTSVEGDAPNANKLGEALGAAVRAELIRQKRPGGLLA